LKEELAMEKQCKKCLAFKPLDDFYGHGSTKDRKCPFCKICHGAAAKERKLKDPETHAVRQRLSTMKYRSKPENKVRERYSRIKQKYGLLPEQFDAMFEDQKGRCAICSTHEEDTPRGLYVDHCHTTGAVRKLLCQHCNSAIGMLKEDPSLFLRSIAYLEEHKSG
jgi:hypothetical protein